MSLTDDEHRLMELTAELVETFPKIVGEGLSRDGDLREFTWHIHAVQNMILAQAAARAHPDRYRLLGEVLE